MASKNDPIQEEEQMTKLEEGVASDASNQKKLCVSSSAVTLTQKVPLYIGAQLLGSILASCTLSLVFEIRPEAYYGTVPVGSSRQSLVVEFIISFLLMVVISGVATDERPIGEMTGVAVGMTIMLNVFVAGPVWGASMNPARSIGPAIVKHVYKDIWVYIFRPIIGAIAGGFAYNLIRFTDKTLGQITKTASFCP